MRRITTAVLCFLLASIALGNERQTEVTSNEGDAGAQFGKQLLQSAPRVTHDATGGERGAGTLTIGGVGTIGINEVMPGADRARADELSRRAAGLNAGNAQEIGGAALREGLADQTSTGEALKAAITSDAMAESELAGDQADFWERTAKAMTAGQTGSLSGVFSDCQDVVELSKGPVIITERKTEFTCEVNESVAPRCGRQREVIFAEIGRQAEPVVVYDAMVTIPPTGSVVAFDVGGLANRMRHRGHSVAHTVSTSLPKGVTVTREDPSEANGWRGTVVFSAAAPPECPSPPGQSATGSPACGAAAVPVTTRLQVTVTLAAGDWYVEEILEGPGDCLNRYVQEFACPIRFSCASEIDSLDGRPMTAALADRVGMRRLYEDAEGLEGENRPVACAVAEAVPFCTVCANEDDNSNCVTPDVRLPAGKTCGALERDQNCVEQGTRQCILRDESDPNVCVTWSRTFVCTEREATEPEIISTVRNSCDLPDVACVGDGCRRPEDLAGDREGTSLQQGLAGLAVAQAMTSDVTTVHPREAQRSGPAPTPSAPPPTEAHAWGYDQDDGEGFTDGASDLTSTAPVGAPPIDTSTIQVFRGEAHTCKRALGGLIRCCQPTRTDANQRYWNLFSSLNRGALAGQLMSREGPSQGSWAALAGGGSLNALSQSLTSGRENVAGGGSGAAAGGAGSMQDIHTQFMQQARREIKPNLSPGWACNQREFDLAVQREIGNCSFAGTFCSRRVFGVCLQTREAYCCYSSPMSRLLRAHADGGTIQHGDPRRPNCAGISLERMASIDWDALDVTPLVSNMQQGGAFPSSAERGSGAVERFTGSGATAGGADRVNVIDRTSDRLGAIDVDAAANDIRAEALTYRPEADTETSGPAVLSFSTTYHIGRPGAFVNLIVTRSGAEGSASSVVAVTSGASAVQGIDGATQSWGPGDTENRIIRVRVADNAIPGTNVLIRLTSANTLGAVTTATLEVIE